MFHRSVYLKCSPVSVLLRWDRWLVWMVDEISAAFISGDKIKGLTGNYSLLGIK